MAFPVLRPVPPGDPRPTLFSDVVVRRAYEILAPSFESWAICHVMGDRLEQVEKQIVEALAVNDGEPYQTARYLEDAYDWRPDYMLLGLFNSVVMLLEQKIIGVTLEWVVRTKFRFPGRGDDLIVYKDMWGYLRTARVFLVRNSDATAKVKFEDSDRIDLVFAEDVVENKTTGESVFDLKRKIPLTLTQKIVPLK